MAEEDKRPTKIGQGKRQKLTVEEAGFRQGQGLASFRCGECFFYEQGKCRIVKANPSYGDVCNNFEPDRKGGMTSTQSPQALVRRSTIDHGGEKKKSMANLEDGVIAVGPLRKLVPVVRANKLLLITKVAEDKQTGIRRWFARASGIERDLFNERMSVVLFNDFINRVENRDEVPEPFSSKAWNGGLPYLGIAHYLDMSGLGIVGTTEQLYIDGDLLKARGQFKNSPVALAAYESIKADIEKNTPLEQRVRISIAFIDWAHDHEGKGGGNFKRRTLLDRCELCADGRGEKVYLAGQLVHLALTRIPAYTTATIELQEE
jgi:hypothetical protein